jgi:hypothetical protein
MLADVLSAAELSAPRSEDTSRAGEPAVVTGLVADVIGLARNAEVRVGDEYSWKVLGIADVVPGSI